ncbi:MAG: hypothetical protein CFH41_01150 [Alphaproteobacteria bacterium MarineAlpha11_Bin1]|nr:MAG: hypothetical protein CFH41_01150 [Alphaproteobacteria bacterium MarineAlpha11_Bin1]|tara:strand:- start:14622 stop:15650 length:1029 start_codon:yes stop_codon:yes gene_type:complete
MKVPAARADVFVANPPDDIRGMLIYGPDLGLVRERAESLTKTIAGSLSDPFNVAEFTPADLRNDPSRLIDEACALSMMGGRRVVRLREATEAVTSAATDALEANGDALIIIEAGDLNPRSKLRGLFEKGNGVASIPCYMDEEASLKDLVLNSLNDAGLKADKSVVSWITSNLGADRMVSRMELEKLVLFMLGQSEVTLESAQAIIGDAAAITSDDVVFAAAGGDLKGLTVALSRARFEGVSAVSLLRAASRHLSRLEEVVIAITAGAAPDQAMKSLRPPVFFKQQIGFRNQIKLWRLKTLARARAELIKAEIDCKTSGMPDDALCERTFMRLAAMAGARVPK